MYFATLWTILILSQSEPENRNRVCNPSGVHAKTYVFLYPLQVNGCHILFAFPLAVGRAVGLFVNVSLCCRTPGIAVGNLLQSDLSL